MRKQLLVLTLLVLGALEASPKNAVAQPVTQAPPVQPVTQAPPVQPVTQAPPVQPVTQAPPVQPVTQAPPAQPVYLAQPNQPIFLLAPPPPERVNLGWAQSRVGFELTLAGPNSLIGGGFAYQPIRWVELRAWAGYNHASAAGTTYNAYAEANITLVTGMARARIWPMERHSVVIDTGLGITSYSMSANGHGTSTSNAGDTLDYKRSGIPGIFNVGVGYGYRSNSAFRIAVILGALVHTNKLAAGTVTSGGSFTADDRASLQANVDASGDSLTKTRAYLDVSIGFLF